MSKQVQLKTLKTDVKTLTTENIALKNEITKLRLGIMTLEKFTPMLRKENQEMKAVIEGQENIIEGLNRTRNRLAHLLTKEIEMSNSVEGIIFTEPGHIEMPKRNIVAEIAAQFQNGTNDKPTN